MSRLVCFFCSRSAKEALRSAEEGGWRKPDDLELIELPCSGRIEVAELLRAFTAGAEAVAVVGCLEGNCQFHSGNYEARKSVQRAKAILKEVGMNEARLEMFNVASNQIWKMPEIVREMESRSRMEEGV